MRITKEVIATIAALEDRKGRLTPEQVVEEARPEESVLHPCFEWNDSTAAESWRIEQARVLIKRVKIVVEVEDRQVRVVAYVRDAKKEACEPGYVALMNVTQRGTREVMADELERVIELLTRVEGIALVKYEELPENFAAKVTALKDTTERLQATL